MSLAAARSAARALRGPTPAPQAVPAPAQALGSPVEALERPIKDFITIDFETYYDADFSLSKMTTEAYIRDPRFQVIGVGVKVNGDPTVWMDPKAFGVWAAMRLWTNTAILAHHAHFDGLILAHHYHVKPAFWVDTLSMARAIHGTEVGGSLAKLAVHYGAGEKGHEVVLAKGKRLADFTDDEYAAYGRYCVNDVDLTFGIFQKMSSAGFPEAELWLIDTTVRMFTEPSFKLDEPRLQAYLVDEQKRKADLLALVASDKADLMSNPKFALALVGFGIDPPMKLSPSALKKGEEKWTYAFSKSDTGMQALLEHEDPRVRALVEARIGVKSTTNETRTERFLKSGKNGADVPVYLKYCLAAETPVLTHRGWKPIVRLESEDLLWDGVEWVQHNGVICQGEKEVWTHSGISATPDHKMLTRAGWKPWAELVANPSLFRSALPLATSPSLPGFSGRIKDAGWDLIPSSGVSVGGKGSSTDATCALPSDAQNVTPGRGNSRTLSACATQKSCPTKRTASGLSVESAEPSTGALTQSATFTTTMEAAGSRFAGSGERTARRSWFTFKRCLGGIIRSWISTGSTMIEATNPETSALCPGLPTVSTSERFLRFSRALIASKRRTLTYDVRSAGPRSRFTILTDRGPLIAHNCGAHTGRWSGGDSMNFQNLMRGGTLRASLLAPPGKMLVVADSAQIEPRVTAWLSGHMDLMETFRRNDASGEDFYSDAGSAYFGRKLSKKETPVERQVAKSMLIGLGYGLGWAKFSQVLLAGALGGDPVQFRTKDAEQYGVNVDAFESNSKFAQRVEEMPSRLSLEDRMVHCAVTRFFVNKYRNTNAPIVELWAGMERVLGAMEEGAQAAFGPGECLRTVRHGIVMPNGLLLRYPGLRREDSGYTYMGGPRGKMVTKTYGGAMTENIVQALARTVVAEQMLRIRAAGYHIVTMSHDEVVFLADESDAENALQLALTAMKTAPDWCRDLPLNAAGDVGKSYGDAK